MRIRSFHIDGFGIFSNVTVPALAPGLSIFLGNNEAGKSTCLDFFRTILTGYPDYRSKELAHPPVYGGQAGGSLTLETLRHGLVRLTRRPGNGGGIVSLTDADGKAMDAGVLDQILSGVTREVYRNVFGFSLSELQTFDSLNSDGVRHALYGASFGMGLRSPGQIFKILDAQMDSLFKPGGSKPAINVDLQEWDKVRKRVQAAEQESARFDALSLELRAEEANLVLCREQKNLKEQERRQLERRLGVWRQWDEWRKIKARQERLEPVSPTFPQDGPARLNRAQENVESSARQAALMQERYERTQEILSRTHVDAAMLAALPEIQSLAERKSSYRTANTSLPSQQAALTRAHADLQRQLTSLGPDWTCDRIRQTNRSLFAREELERQAGEMNTAMSSHTAAVDNLEKSNRTVEKAEHDLEKTRTVLEHLPMPVSSLDDEGRESLHRTLNRIEETRTRLPEKERALREASTTFTRTYEPLRLRAGNALQYLKILADSQEKALILAQKVHESMGIASEATMAATQAQEAEDSLKNRIERLHAQQKANQGPTRSTLDARTAAVRSLRHVTASLSVEQDRCTELEDRKAGMVAPAPLKSWPLIGIGALLMLFGVAMLIARWKFGLVSVPINPQMALPLTLWSGYLVVLTGVGFLAGGLPRSGPEAKRHQMEAEHLTSRLASSQQRIQELEGQIASLCDTAGLSSADPITLDASEMMLERERELCVTEERLSKEMSDLHAEFAACKERTRRLQNARNQTENAVQQARRRWHEFLVGCHVESIPAPEAAGAFFGRVEASCVAHAAVTALEKELADMNQSLQDLENTARALPPVAEILANRLSLHAEKTPRSPETSTLDMALLRDAAPTDSRFSPVRPAALSGLDEVLAALRQVTDACREADAAAAERLKAAAAVHNAEINLDRASTVQDESVEALKQSDQRLSAARSAWSESLKTLGLGVDLSPPTVREALECMERCLGAEAELARLEDDITRLSRERDALILPLQALLTRFDRQARLDADGEIHWISTLDALLQDASAMEKLAAEYQRLEATLLEQADQLRTAQATWEDALQARQTLLDQAQVPDAEEFLRHAHIREEMESCQRRREDLEVTLQLAADNTPLESFLESFENFDRDERETHVRQLAEDAQNLESVERGLSTRIATLDAQLTTLTAADDLAQLRQQEAALAESLRCKAYEWSRNAVARRLLEEAKRRFEQERQPQVIRSASEIFATITQGSWASIAASLEDSSLTVLPARPDQEQGQGEALSPSVLSRGTQEQLYLSLRLAYIRNHASHATALPIIMDDILVNFDPNRARHTAHALMGLTQGKGAPAHQILFFTCHPHIAAMLQELMPESTLFDVNKGTIQAQQM